MAIVNRYGKVYGFNPSTNKYYDIKTFEELNDKGEVIKKIIEPTTPTTPEKPNNDKDKK